MKNRKKSIKILFLLVAVVVCVAGLSLGYLKTQSNTLTNNFEVGSIQTTIDEQTPTIDDEEKDIINKEPKITNEGKSDALVRVKIIVSPENLWNCEDPNNIGNKTDKIGLNIFENWIYNDGYFYYNGILSPGNSINVFTEVSNFIDNDGKVIQNVDSLDISIYQESIQTFVRDKENKDIVIDAFDDSNNFSHSEALNVWKIYDELDS